jgi:hypothetical protein
MAMLTPESLAPLLNVGAVGLILAWFMFKNEPRMERMEEAIDRNTRGQMLFLLGVETMPRAITEQAQQMLQELESAQTLRNRK